MASGKFDSNTPGVPAVIASATAPGPGSNGVHGITSSDVDSAVYGEHTAAGIGVFGRGGPNGGQGVFGQTASGASGVYGKNTGPSVPNYVPTSTNPGVFGESASGTGVVGISNLAGVPGQIDNPDIPGGVGVVGSNDQILGRGVLGQANGASGIAVSGSSSGSNGIGVSGVSSGDNGIGVKGIGSVVGLDGESIDGTGVFGSSSNGAGLAGYSNNVAVYAHNNSVSVTGNDAYLGARSVAGEFHGDVYILGRILKTGGGFRIDHPLDPAAKYLSHSFVESSDMKNIYDGIAVLDAGGEAGIELPSWFDTLNCDFRYQLTCIGGCAPVYIAQEVQSNGFKIGGGTPGMKVSWQVTGIRQDAWAKAHPLPVEEEKPAAEQGYYLNPELYGVSGERHIRNARYPENVRWQSRPPQRGSS
jgi:hypothetical protein